jgi:hypothetical protein
MRLFWAVSVLMLPGVIRPGRGRVRAGRCGVAHWPGWPWRDPGQVVFRDSLLGGQPAQQAGQLAALGPGQGGADLVLVAASGGLYLL